MSLFIVECIVGGILFAVFACMWIGSYEDDLMGYDDIHNPEDPDKWL